MKILIPVSLLILLCWSCQHEPDSVLDPSPPDPPPPTINDSSYLKTYVIFDTSFAPGLDTLKKFSFDYDTQKRLKHAVTYVFDPGTTNYEYMEEETRFYNGNDTLPYKVALFDNDFLSPPDIDTAFITYQNGIVVKDSIVYHYDNRLNEYVTSAIKKIDATHFSLISTITYFNTNGTSSTTSDSVISMQNWQNNNLINGLDSVWSRANADDFAFNGERYEYLNEYDNNPNVLKSFTLPYPINIYERFIGNPGIIYSMGKNNATRTKRLGQTDFGIIDYDYKMFYQYRSDGYATAIRNNDTGDHWKVLITYTRL